MSNDNQEYGASEIQVLEGLEAVRKRPGMYIGSTSEKGLHHLVYEVMDNSIDEGMAGYGSDIFVTINKDNSITVKDNGRGIPVDLHANGRPALEVVLTVLHAGGKFGNGAYKVSGGLHGVGVSVVNALSERLDAVVRRNGKIYKMSFEKGNVVEEMKVVGKTDKKDDTGTMISFKPDPTIFETIEYDFKTLRHRFRELAFLNKNITIHITDERNINEETSLPHTETYHFEGGIVTFVKEVSKRKDTVINNDVIFIQADYNSRNLNVGEDGKTIVKAQDSVEVAFQYNDSYNENLYSFVNNINTIDGGTHVQGFKLGLLQVLNKFAKDLGYIKDGDPSLTQDDIKEGLVSVISIKYMEPQFEGQTKGKLGSSEAKNMVKDAVVEFVTRYLEQHPEECKKILEKNCLAAKAREAARKAKELARNKSSITKSYSPGKLAACSSKDPEQCEIYLVEGDSAGGSAKQGRDRNYQAILPLRGKIINVEKATIDKILNNEEIRSMIASFGCGIKDDFDESKLKYHKIVIMTDADVDGAHIRTLLLTFFYRFMPQLIINGRIFIAQPPLYKIQKNKQIWYTYNDKEHNEKIKELGNVGVTIQRYKGLGEMNPEQLFDTTMNPETRTIIRSTIKDAEEADERFSLLMGQKVPPRREFIIENAHKMHNLDF